MNKSSKVWKRLLLVWTFAVFFSALMREHLCIRYVGTFRRCSACNNIKKNPEKSNQFCRRATQTAGNGINLPCWYLITQLTSFLATSLLFQPCLSLETACSKPPTDSIFDQRQQSTSSMSRLPRKTATETRAMGDVCAARMRVLDLGLVHREKELWNDAKATIILVAGGSLPTMYERLHRSASFMAECHDSRRIYAAATLLSYMTFPIGRASLPTNPAAVYHSALAHH